MKPKQLYKKYKASIATGKWLQRHLIRKTYRYRKHKCGKNLYGMSDRTVTVKGKEERAIK